MAIIRPAAKPNRRGARSREVVLDAAERLMARHGFDGATMAAIAKEAHLQQSSVYHFFGSKNGVLLAVMERGAVRFFTSLPAVRERAGDAHSHLVALVETLSAALERHPDFLRLLIVLAAQPPTDEEREVHDVVNRVRDMALAQLREQIAIAFGLEPDAAAVESMARFALAAIDGAFVAVQADPRVRLSDLLEPLPGAVIGIHDLHSS